MINPAIVADVEDMWRPLTVAETTVATGLLEYAWLLLQARSLGLVDRITAGTVPSALARYVIVEAVLRVLRNPHPGRKQESRQIDDFTESWTLDDTVAMGSLFFTLEELSQLEAPRLRARAFSIAPGGY